MKFDTDKKSDRNIFENDNLTCRKIDGRGWDISQGDFNLKGTKSIIEFKIKGTLDCFYCGIA